MNWIIIVNFQQHCCNFFHKFQKVQKCLSNYFYLEKGYYFLNLLYKMYINLSCVSMFTFQFSVSMLQTCLFVCLFVCFWRDSPQRARASLFTRFLDHTRRTTVARTPLDEWSARRRDLYLTTYNTHDRHTRPRWDLNPQSQQASDHRPTP